MCLCANILVCFELIAFIISSEHVCSCSTSVFCQLWSEMMMYTAEHEDDRYAFYRVLSKDTLLPAVWNLKTLRDDNTVDITIFHVFPCWEFITVMTLRDHRPLSLIQNCEKNELVVKDKCCNNMQLKPYLHRLVLPGVLLWYLIMEEVSCILLCL